MASHERKPVMAEQLTPGTRFLLPSIAHQFVVASLRESQQPTLCLDSSAEVDAGRGQIAEAIGCRSAVRYRSADEDYDVQGAIQCCISMAH
jgi:hypothetical protein